MLAKIGLKHHADPSRCAPAALRGLPRLGRSGEHHAAVEATPRGRALFDEGGKLVDSVLQRGLRRPHREQRRGVAAACPTRSLRGRPDTLPGFNPRAPRGADRVPTPTPPMPAAVELCPQLERETAGRSASPRRSSMTSRGASKLGSIFTLTVVERGVLRARRGCSTSRRERCHQIRGELRTSPLFRECESGMFEVRLEKDARNRPATWIFTGGCWGHGVGMCQTGAIGRARSRPELPRNSRALLQRRDRGPNLLIWPLRHGRRE